MQHSGDAISSRPSEPPSPALSSVRATQHNYELLFAFNFSLNIQLDVKIYFHSFVVRTIAAAAAANAQPLGKRKFFPVFKLQFRAWLQSIRTK